MAERPRHTLRRLAFGYMTAFGLVTLLAGGATYLYSRHMLARELDGNMEARMRELQRVYKAGGLTAVVQRIDGLKTHGIRTFGYVLTDRSGQRLVSLDGVGRLPPGWSTLRFQDGDEGRSDPARALTAALGQGASLTVLADSDFLEQFDDVAMGFVGLAFGILSALAIATGFVLERQVRLRLAALNETAREIFDGNLDRRVPVNGRNDEFDAVATTVNAMLDRMTMLLEEVRRVSHYIAHDLRAPLVKLRDQLQRTSNGSDPAGTQSAIEQCDEIIRLFGAILRIRDIDRALIAKAAVPVDLSQLVSDLAEAHVAVAEDCAHRLDHAVVPGIVVAGDQELLGQLLVNLLDNGLRHTPAGTHIAIGLQAADGVARLTVSDDGPSLPEERRRSLLTDDRLASSETPYRDALGLKLVRVIVEAHRGTIALTDTHPGLCFEITLPLHSVVERAAIAA